MKARSRMVAIAAAAAMTTLALAPNASARRTSNDDWSTYNHDGAGSRYAATERVLSAQNADELHVRWWLPTPGAIHGTPAVVGGMIYAGDATGVVYAVHASDGSVVWTAPVGGPVTDSPLVVGTQVFVGDQTGAIHAIDRTNGTILWSARPNTTSPTAAVYGSGISVKIRDGRTAVVFGIASNEEVLGNANRGPVTVYPCCAFRGSVVALDPADGSIVWQRYLVTDDEQRLGASGVGVWSTPTYDVTTGELYVSTGNNYSEPATPLSDAVVALDTSTGAVKWSRQLQENDVWNWGYTPDSEHADYDFGDSPQLIDVNGRRALVVGQKSGMLYLLDARTGAVLDGVRVEEPGPLGGLFADSATARGVTFANGSDWQINPETCHPCSGGVGHISAVDTSSTTMRRRWTVALDAPSLAAVAVANGLVFAPSSRDAHIDVIDVRDGTMLRQIAVGVPPMAAHAAPVAPLPALSGPSIAGGSVYVGVGDVFGFVSPTPTSGALVAIGAGPT